MSILIKLRDNRNLSEAESSVRDYILRNPKEVLTFTVYDLARESFTSAATVVRLCKKMRVDGFPAMKVLLAEELKYFQDMQLKLLDSTTIGKEDTPLTIVEKITNISVKTIEETRALVDVEQLMAVAGLFRRAAVLDFYGVGASNLVAIDAQFKFMRLGKPSISYGQENRQYVQSLNSDSTHVGFIVSYSGETKAMLRVAQNLKKNGTPVVVLTTSSENSLSRLANYSLCVTSKETIFRSGAMASRTAQLYVVDLLFTLYCSLDYDENIEKIVRTKIAPEDNV